jgi:hypothetical protein
VRPPSRSWPFSCYLSGGGFFVAWLMITSFGGGRTITWPGPEYYAALSLSLLLALAAVTAGGG